EGGRGGAGDHARRGSRGADRPRREAGGRLRSQVVDAAGRARPEADGDRLAERRHRPLRRAARGRDAAEPRDLGAREGARGVVVSAAEVERRYARIREAMARDGLDAVIVSGNEYTGFEGAVTYTSG